MTRRQASLGKEGGNVMAIEVCLADLQRLGACEDARTAFAQRFPDGASYRELLLAMADHPHGIDWWEWFAPRVKALCRIREAYAAQKRPLWEAYAAQERPLREAYEAQKRPLWEAYAAQERPLREAYAAQERPLWEAYEAQKRPLWEAYAAQERPLREQYDAARRQAIREAAATLGCDVEEAQT